VKSICKNVSKGKFIPFEQHTLHFLKNGLFGITIARTQYLDDCFDDNLMLRFNVTNVEIE
jgi:hypothetical protein